MATAAEIYASFTVKPDPDVVVSLDAQFDRAGDYASYLIVTGISTTLHVQFVPKGPRGKAQFDEPGVDLFFGNDLIPELSGTYKLEILREKKAALYKDDKLLWSGESVKHHNTLSGVHYVTF